MNIACLVGVITIAATVWAQVPSPTTVQNTQFNAAASQPTDANKPEAGVDEGPGRLLEAELTRGLDARKVHVGDPVLAKCTQEFRASGEVLIPKKAKLIGHVAEVQEKSKGKSESTLGIVWDKALLRDGREVPLNASIQAIAPPAMMVENSGEGPLLGSRANPRTASTVVRHLNSPTSRLRPAGESERLAVDSSLGGKTTGVVGIKGLQLDSTASSSYKGSVIHSSSRNVRLESGTRLILRVSVQ